MKAMLGPQTDCISSLSSSSRVLSLQRRTLLHRNLCSHALKSLQRSGSWTVQPGSVVQRPSEVAKTRTSLGDRSLTVAGPRLWNNVPLHLRDSLTYFLKTHLFKSWGPLRRPVWLFGWVTKFPRMGNGNFLEMFGLELYLGRLMPLGSPRVHGRRLLTDTSQTTAAYYVTRWWRQRLH